MGIKMDGLIYISALPIPSLVDGLEWPDSVSRWYVLHCPLFEQIHDETPALLNYGHASTHPKNSSMDPTQVS